MEVARAAVGARAKEGAFAPRGSFIVDGVAGIDGLVYGSDRDEPAWDRFALLLEADLVSNAAIDSIGRSLMLSV